MAQNEFVLNKLHNAAIKEATTAWAEASELKEKGKPYKTKKEILQMINKKPEYKGNVQVCERTIRRLVSEGIIGLSPPRRGNPGTIPQVIYKALLEAVISFISIHQASGKQEYKMSEISKMVNNVVNSNSDENQRGNQLMERLRKDFGPEINLGKAEKVEERWIKWTTYNNLKTWAGSNRCTKRRQAIIHLLQQKQTSPWIINK